MKKWVMGTLLALFAVRRNAHKRILKNPLLTHPIHPQPNQAYWTEILEYVGTTETLETEKFL